MDRIIIKGLKLYAFHGVNPEEKENGQDFILDISAYLPLAEAGKTDDLEDTVSYAKIIKLTRAVFTAEKYDLIEAAARKVACEILKSFDMIESITVTLKKPDAPVKADFDYVAVEISLSRKDMEAE